MIRQYGMETRSDCCNQTLVLSQDSAALVKLDVVLLTLFLMGVYV